MTQIKKHFVFLLIMILASSIIFAENPLASKKLIQALTEEVSGEIAFNSSCRWTVN